MKAQVFPKVPTAIKLFTTGATVGPIVDSLHNQCLLEYDRAPISLAWPAFLHPLASPATVDHIISSNILATNSPYFLCTSWLVPPLLGFAYVVLGAILPNIISVLISQFEEEQNRFSKFKAQFNDRKPSTPEFLKTRAIQAVISTAFIIKLSELLQTNSLPIPATSHQESLNLVLMVFAALSQWALLDKSLISLLVATITAIGGPLSEIPFVASGCWHYIPEAANYFPLQTFSNLFPLNNLPADLALSDITGPCYFAVTMDAIALGRWYDSMRKEKND